MSEHKAKCFSGLPTMPRGRPQDPTRCGPSRPFKFAYGSIRLDPGPGMRSSPWTRALSGPVACSVESDSSRARSLEGSSLAMYSL